MLGRTRSVVNGKPQRLEIRLISSRSPGGGSAAVSGTRRIQQASLPDQWASEGHEGLPSPTEARNRSGGLESNSEQDQADGRVGSFLGAEWVGSCSLRSGPSGHRPPTVEGPAASSPRGSLEVACHCLVTLASHPPEHRPQGGVGREHVSPAAHLRRHLCWAGGTLGDSGRVIRGRWVCAGRTPQREACVGVHSGLGSWSGPPGPPQLASWPLARPVSGTGVVEQSRGQSLRHTSPLCASAPSSPTAVASTSPRVVRGCATSASAERF